LKKGALPLVCLLLILSSAVMSQQNMGLAPVTVKIQLEKDEVLPGEIVHVTLSNFKDAHGVQSYSQSRIIVTCVVGEIIGGTPSVKMPGNVFFVGNGTVEFDFRAPLHCDTKNVFLSIFNSLIAAPAERLPLAETEPMDQIEKKELRLLCPDYALMEYTYYYHTAQGNTSTTTDINVIIRVDLEPFNSPNMLQIKSVNVLHCRGLTNYISGDTRDEATVSSFSPGLRGSIVQIQRDVTTGKIAAVNFPLIQVSLSWMGSDSIVPPEFVTVGPVTEKSDAEEEAAKKKMKAIRDKGVDTKETRMQKMQTFFEMQGAMSHPDNRLKSGDGIGFSSGGGNVEKQITDGVLREIYKWELYINQK
jgi:hypothetical protein